MKHHERLALSLLLTTFAATSCGGGGSSSNSDDFQVRSTNKAAATNPMIRISGAYIAYLAAEDTSGPGGTDLNGDNETDRAVAQAVNTSSRTQFNVAVAARDMAWAGNELYLVVNELQDRHDWNGDMLMDDDVLLHWSQAMPMPERVDDVDPTADLAILGLGARILYVSKTETPGVGGSNLRFVESTDPLTPIPIGTTDAVGPLSARILGEDEGLVFLAFDETTVMRSLNGDMDPDDTNVLGLLDSTSNASVVRSTALAIDPDSPRRAKKIATGNWHVGFLVDEADEGAVSRNSATAIGPSFRACAANDIDTTDNVLCVLTYATWNADPVANPPVNHGLPGQDTIAFAGNYVATIVSELADTCDLNNDSDTTDFVVRWEVIAAHAGDPLVPAYNLGAARVENRPLADVPGGGHGLYELQNRFVIVASEADGANIDANDAVDANLVGWVMPSGSPSGWDFLHGSNNMQYVEASWVSPRESGGRLGVAFTERIGGASLNVGSTSNPGDMDTLDSIPTFATFASGRLVFPGVLLALDKDSAAYTTAKGWSFYRLSEPEDSRDTNHDGDEDDFIVEATNYTTGVTFGLSVTVEASDRVVEIARFGAVQCAAFLASEDDQGTSGTDFNTDGDRMDLVLRWFRF